MSSDPQVSPLDMGIMAQAMASNSTNITDRYTVAKRAGLSYGGERDLYETLGYNRAPQAEDYLTVYLRNHIARRIVDAPVKATWSSRPTITDDATDDSTPSDEAETEFEQALEYLFDEHRLVHYLKRVDTATRIGEYGLLFLGLASGEIVDLDADARETDYRTVLDTKDESGPDDLAYMSTFTQGRVSDLHETTHPRDPRYGMPKTYDLEFETANTSRTEVVHHSRVIHVAEDVLENEIYGRPALEAVYNRLEDLEKVIGGSAEMFYRGADRKFQLNYTGEGSPTDADELAEQADDMVHGLRNVLQTSNVELNEIQGQAVDPSGVVEQILKLIAGETGIPLRMLTGSERGELASSQDRATFYERIGERQAQHAEPNILRPVIDRLVDLGLVPSPEGGSYSVEWPEQFELTELERAELMEKKAKALKTAAPMGDPGSLADPAEIREQILDFSPERGSETSLADGETGVPADPDVDDETDADRRAFEDILGDLDLPSDGEGPPADDAAPPEAATDGGVDDPKA